MVDELNSLIAQHLDGFLERFGYEPGEQEVELASEDENSAALITEFGDRLPAPAVIAGGFDDFLEKLVAGVRPGFDADAFP